MRKLVATLFVLIMVCVLVFAQTTTPNLQLTLPAHGTPNYDVILNNNFSIIDTAVGVLQSTFQGAWVNSTQYSKGQEVSFSGGIYVSLINGNIANTPGAVGSTSWAFMFSTGGTVMSVSDLAPLFTTSTRTSNPTFVLTNATPNQVWAGPASGSSGPPGYRFLVSADMPATIGSNTTGQAGSAVVLSTTPTPCATGNYARGIDIFGNSVGCTAAGSGGGGPATLTAVSHFFMNSYNSGTLTFGTAQPAFTDISGTATTAQLPSATVYNSQANTFTSGSKQTFTASSTTAGFNLTALTADPSSLANGDEWFRSDTGRFMYRAGGVSQQMAYVSDLAFASITGTITKAQSFSTTVFNDQANSYVAGDKQTFASNATNAGVGHAGVSSDPSTLSNGDSWYRTDTSRLMVRANGVSQQIAHVSDIPTPVTTTPTNVNVTPVTVSGTTTETTLQTVTTKTGELNTVGRWITLTVRGTYTTSTTAGTLTIKVKNGTTVLLATSAVTLNATLTNAAFKLVCDLGTVTTGATGTQEVHCDTILNGTSVNGWAITAPVTSDLTGATVLTVTATFSQATSGMTARLTGYERQN